MAQITRMQYDDKGWPLSCRITVSHGRTADGKQQRETITWHADPLLETTKNRREKSIETAAIEFELSVKNGSYARGGNMTLKDYLEKWLEEHVKRNLTTGSYTTCESWIRTVIVPEIGMIRLKDLRKSDLKDLYARMEDGKLKNNPRQYKHNSIRRVHQTISSALSSAVDDEILQHNVAIGLKIRNKDKMADVKHFEDHQAIAFLQSLDEPYSIINRGRPHKDGTPSKEHVFVTKIQLQLKVLFYLALCAGLRRGELLTLTWDDIDFENNTVDVNKSYEADKSKGASKETKTPGSNRIVKVPQICMDLLHELQEERAQYKADMAGLWQGDPSHDVLFIKEDGSPMGIDTPNRAFKHAIQRYNQTHDEKLPEITLHGLRHTCISILIDSGMPDVAVKEVSGHSDLETLRRVYSHAFRRTEERAADIMEEKLSGISEKRAPSEPKTVKISKTCTKCAPNRKFSVKIKAIS